MADKKFIGTAKGFGEGVKATITATSIGQITNIKVEGPNETPNVGGKAIKKFNEEILPKFVKEEGSAGYQAADFSKIDAVSGASLTTNAVREACLKAVGRDNSEAAHLKKEVNYLAKQVKELQEGNGLGLNQLYNWLANRENVAASAGAGAFLKGKENAPTDEELRQILFVANNYMWCHMLTAPHFIVIRDPKEQNKLLKDMGITGDGTVTILVLADGVKDQAHHKEQYSPRNASFNQEHYWQMTYCIYEAGEAASMLNLAARTKGYRVRSYGAIDLYNQGVKDHDPKGNGIDIWYAGGNFDIIQGDYYDISKYTKPKNGGAEFKHMFFGGHKNSQMTGRMVDVNGNLQLLDVIVMGKIDEVDASTGATAASTGYKQNQNFSFWDPQDEDSNTNKRTNDATTNTETSTSDATTGASQK